MAADAGDTRYWMKNLSSLVVAYVCVECGALVHDTLTHNQWHVARTDSEAP